MENKFTDYNSSQIVPQKTLLEKFNQLIKYMVDNPTVNIYMIKTSYFENKETYRLEDVVNRNKKIYFVSSKSSEELFEYYNKFYKNGKKIIYNIIDEIDEISLAFWIMDDGSLQKHKAKTESCHYALATHLFS